MFSILTAHFSFYNKNPFDHCFTAHALMDYKLDNTSHKYITLAILYIMVKAMLFVNEMYAMQSLLLLKSY